MGTQAVIKKYPNRRLYHTGERRYVNLEDIERLVRDDVDFRVVDATTGQDLTRRILSQVILEQAYEPFFPAEMLRFAIKHRGTTFAWADFAKRVGGIDVVRPWAELLGMFTAREGQPWPAAPSTPEPPEEDPAELHEEVDALRQRLEEIESRLGRKRK